VGAAQGGTVLVNTNTSVREGVCASSECRAPGDILPLIGNKWSVMVIGVLSKGSRRYNQIFRQIDGVSQRMLTLTLKALERDGLLTRTMFPTIPPRVDYALTERGQSLIAPLSELWSWAQANRKAIENDRREYDHRSDGG
jgi:DNA-binding HxlR family transcriptional regulator